MVSSKFYKAEFLIKLGCYNTAQAHIYYIYNLPNLSKIKFLAESQGFFPECPGFLDIPDLAQRVRVIKV
jgi:hypothetical protein